MDNVFVRALRFVVDSGGKPNGLKPLRKLLAQGVTPEFFYTYDAAKGVHATSAYSDVFEIALDYMAEYSALPPADYVNEVFQRDTGLDRFKRNERLRLVSEIVESGYSIKRLDLALDELFDKYASERLSVACKKSLDTADTTTAEAALAQLQEEVRVLASKVVNRKADPSRTSMSLPEFVSVKEEQRVKRGAFVEIVGEYGIASIDAHCQGGLYGGRVTVFAANASSAKSMILQHVAFHNMMNGVPTVYASLENDDDDVYIRLLAQQAGIPISKLQSGLLDEQEWERHAAACDRLRDPAFHEKTLIVPSAKSYTVSALRREIENKFVGETSPKVFVADYINLFAHANARLARHERVEENLVELRRMAKEFNMSVVTAAQFNREGMKVKDGKRPSLEQMQYDSIRKVADNVFLMWPDEDRPPQGPEVTGGFKGRPGYIHLQLARARNHPAGATFKLLVETSVISFNDAASAPPLPTDPKARSAREGLDQEYKKYASKKSRDAE